MPWERGPPIILGWGGGGAAGGYTGRCSGGGNILEGEGPGPEEGEGPGPVEGEGPGD